MPTNLKAAAESTRSGVPDKALFGDGQQTNGMNAAGFGIMDRSSW